MKLWFRMVAFSENMDFVHPERAQKTLPTRRFIERGQKRNPLDRADVAQASAAEVDIIQLSVAVEERATRRGEIDVRPFDA